MIFFTAPFVLLGLLALPGLYFLLRLTPPPARHVVFPPVALLRGLTAVERTAARMPWWLLLLRLLAVLLLVTGLAGPYVHPVSALPGSGPVLLVVDNGWAAASDWPARRAQALQLAAAAGQAGRGVAVLATARNGANQAPCITAVMAASQARQLLAALAPQPWPVDRVGATAALAHMPPASAGSVIYLADGITDGPGFAAFMAALHPARIYSAPSLPALLANPALAANGDLTVNGPPAAQVLAQTQNGDVLAAATINQAGLASLALPASFKNQLARLVLAGQSSAGATLLLDSGEHAAIVGLLAGAAGAQTPFLGSLYYLRRAMPAGTQTITGGLAALLAAKANVIIMADAPLNQADRALARQFVAAGGVLVRFAGPLTAQTPDPLTPDPLLAQDRRLGGALTWSAPQKLAPFSGQGPFAGLPVDRGVSVSRQILADPATLDATTIWASLDDKTPLVLGSKQQSGFLVTVLTSANTDWSNLVISGMFPQMLARLLGLSQGQPPMPATRLALVRAMDGFGVLGAGVNPASLRADELAGLAVSPLHPPGFYGATAQLALNVGGHVPKTVAAPLPGATAFGAMAAPQPWGHLLLLAAFGLLVADFLASLWLRGVLALPWLAGLVLALALAGSIPARAQSPALQTTLGYVLTGDAATDQISADGLGYLSALVSARSAAQLGPPAGLRPGVDDLSLYPLIYWPLLASSPAPNAAACAALANYMQNGGLLVIDTEGGDAGAPGSGAGFAPGAGLAFQRATMCLNLPPLEPLTSTSVLAHSFYIVPEFPGKFEGAPVLQASSPARDADGVTPVLVGQNDWAGAWARDATGTPEQVPIPGGEAQRTIADRFGANLVIYALTGSYKADQASLPALLNRLSAP